LYPKNHSLDEWFKKAFRRSAGKRTPFAKKEVRSANFIKGEGTTFKMSLNDIRCCRLRGIAKVSEQYFLTAAAQNLKKIATVLSSRPAPILFIF